MMTRATSRTLRRLLATMFAIGCIAFSSVAFAGAATDVVKAKQTALFDLLKRSDAQNEKKMAAIFDEMLDYQTLAESSLGSEWAPRSDAEKAQFSDLLKQLVRKSYERNLKKTLNFDIEYVGEEASGNAMVVKTKAKSKTDTREDPIEISYRMGDKGGAWKVQDIVTDGVSLVSSYRSQFTKIIKKDGFPALIQKMKDKLAKGDI
jgi:phospholipid transport system substrate-binding protein